MMENKEKNFVSAVIYVHNAEDRISGFLNAVIGILEANFEHSEIICVNDASDDGSLDQIKKAGGKAAGVNITVVSLSYYHGLEAAMNAGSDLAIGDFVFEFDRAILDFDAGEMMKVYRRSLEGYDIVSASPDCKEHFTSKLFYKVFDLFSEMPYQMVTESFRILSRRVINRVNSMNGAVFYRKAAYAGCGLKMDHIRYPVMNDRKMPVPDRKEKAYRSSLAVDAFLMFTGLGYRISMALAVLMMLVSGFMFAYSIAVYISSHPVEGWTTTALFLSASFSGLFGVLAVVIKYLQLLVRLAFRRKNYCFESVEKLTGYLFGDLSSHYCTLKNKHCSG